MLLILLILDLPNLINKSFLKEKLNKDSVVFVKIYQDLKRNSLLLIKRRCKWLKHRTPYYYNSTASFNIASSAMLACGDIHPNPGPIIDATNKHKSKGPVAKGSTAKSQASRL